MRFFVEIIIFTQLIFQIFGRKHELYHSVIFMRLNQILRRYFMHKVLQISESRRFAIAIVIF